MKHLVFILLCSFSMTATAQHETPKEMYTLLAKFIVKPQAVSHFEEACLHSLIESRKEVGNIDMKLYVDQNADNVYYVYSHWANASAYEYHKTLPHSVNIAKVAKASLEKAPILMPMIEDAHTYLQHAIELNPSTTIQKNWEKTGFAMPESVVADPNSDWIYVSNLVNPATPGYISRLSKSGEVDNYKWVEGLNQPCGLAIFGNKLYVGDQDRVHIIDIAAGKLVESLISPDAKTLNDVAIDDTGRVFISDVLGGKIYTIENDQIVLWMDQLNITHPNGLHVDNGQLIVADLGAKLNPDASPQIPGSVYRIDIGTKQIELIKPSYQLGGLDGVVKVGNRYIVTDNSGGDLYAISAKERIRLASPGRGIADLCADGHTIYVPSFTGSVASYTLPEAEPAPTQKGSFSLVDFGDVKLHVYQTNDMMTDYVLILEKAGKSVMIESPAFWDNFDELRSYLTENKLKIDAILPSYHPLGASFIQTGSLADMDVYFTQHMLDYWQKGFGSVMKAGIPKVFGKKVDSAMYKPTVMLKEGETEISGIKMIITKSYDGFDIEIPEINTVYVHILGHNKHSEILSHKHLDSSIVNFTSYLNKGYTTFLSSHDAPETKADMIEKVAYLKGMKKIAAQSHSAEEFTRKMKAAYPEYHERYLPRTAEMLYSKKPVDKKAKPHGTHKH